MKPLISISIILLVSLSILNCHDSLHSKISQTIGYDTSSIFRSSLERSRKAGFKINPQVSDSDIIKRWKAVLVYYPNPDTALYITLGAKKEDRSGTYFSDNCWHFDLASINEPKAYAKILKNIARISKGDLGFQNIDDYCNEKEDNKAWVSFELNGDSYKWDLKVDESWADARMFNNIQDLCKKYDKKGRLTFFPEGQAFVISYLTNEEFKNINETTGIKLEWLNVGHGQVY